MRGVAYHYARDVNGKIAVAGHSCGDGKGEEYTADNEYGNHGCGLSGVFLYVGFAANTSVDADKPQRAPAHKKAACGAYTELQQQFEQYLSGREASAEGNGLE